MSAPEDLLWVRVRHVLAPLGHVCRVENAVSPGTPDTNYVINALPTPIEGWLELKVAAPRPLRSKNHRVRLIHPFTPSQIPWHIERRQAGGRCHTLIETPGWPEPYLVLGQEEKLLRPNDWPTWQELTRAGAIGLPDLSYLPMVLFNS